MPVRTSTVHELELVRTTRTVSRASRCTCAPGRTCARSRTRSAATASSCAARLSGRFGRGRGRRSGCSAARGAPVPAAEASSPSAEAAAVRNGRAIAGAGGGPAPARARRRARRDRSRRRRGDPSGDGDAVNVAHDGRRARAAAARGRDRQLRRRPSRPRRRRRRALRDGARRRRSSPSTRTRASRSATSVELLTTQQRKLELLAELGVEDTLVVRFDLELSKLEPEEFVGGCSSRSAARSSSPGDDFRFGRGRAGDLALLRSLGYDVRRRPRGGGRLVDGDPRAAARAATLAEAAQLLGRPYELDGTVVSGDQRGGTLGYPTANLALGAGPRRPAVRDLRRPRARPPRRGLDRRQPALRRRRAADRAAPPRLRRRPLRRAARARAVGVPARGAGLRLRGGARRPDRPRRRGDARSSAPGLGERGATASFGDVSDAR